MYLVIRAGFGDAWSLLERPATWQTVGRTLLLATTVAAGSVVVGASLAWLVARTRLPGRRVWGVLAVVPLAMPSFVAALALKGAGGPDGFVAEVFHVEAPSLQGLSGATLALVMATFPYVYLLTAAAIRGLDSSLDEAARSLGRGPVRAALAGTLPQLRPALVSGGLLAGLYAISDYGAVSLMRYETITPAIFTRYEAAFDRRPAAVLGLLLVAITGLFLVAERWVRGKSATRLGPGTRRPSPALELGVWRWPALAWAGLVSAVLVLAPIAVMVDWLRRGIENDTIGAVPWSAASTSVALAAVAAVVVTVAAIPVAVLARRYPSPWTFALERTGYAANALPGVVVGLAFVFLGARHLPWIYQTFPLLVLAYLVRFFAQALSGVDNAIGAVNPRLEEAARSLGRSPLRVLGEVTLPLMRPGLLAGATLVFLSVIKELPATRLLLPTGSQTLATQVWRKTDVGAYGAAAVPALLLVAVALPFIAIAVREHVAEHRDALPAAGGT